MTVVLGSVFMVYNNCGPGTVCDGSVGLGRWGCSMKVRFGIQIESGPGAVGDGIAGDIIK